MSYTKHNFQSGAKLYASELNEMDEQIYKNESDIVASKEQIDDIKDKLPKEYGQVKFDVSKVNWAYGNVSGTDGFTVIDNNYMLHSDVLPLYILSEPDIVLNGLNEGYKVSFLFYHSTTEYAGTKYQTEWMTSGVLSKNIPYFRIIVYKTDKTEFENISMSGLDMLVWDNVVPDMSHVLEDISRIYGKTYDISDFTPNTVYSNIVIGEVMSLVPIVSYSGNYSMWFPIEAGSQIEVRAKTVNGKNTCAVLDENYVVVSKIDDCSLGHVLDVNSDGYILISTNPTYFGKIEIKNDFMKDVSNSMSQDIYAPYPQLSANETPDSDFDSDNMTTAQIYAYLDRLVSKHPNMITKEFMGNDATNTYPVNRYIIGDKTRTDYLTTIFVYANEHGPSSDPRECAIIVARLAKDLCESHAKDNKFLNILKKYFRVVIIPVANPYGFDNSTRNNGNNVNLNRNYSTQGWAVQEDTDKGSSAGSEVETQYIMNTIDEYDVQIALDLHCLGNVFEANDKKCHYAGKIDSQNKIESIALSMLRDYELLCSSYGNADYTTKGNAYSYFDQIGIKGLLLEFQSRDGNTSDDDTALHTSNIMEANYTFMLRILNMLISDLNENWDINKFM